MERGTKSSEDPPIGSSGKRSELFHSERVTELGMLLRERGMQSCTMFLKYGQSDFCSYASLM